MGIRVTNEHFIPFKGCYPGTEKSIAEKIKRSIITVGPNTHFWIIVHVVKFKSITIIFAQRIAVSRNSNQLIKFPAASVQGKLRGHPAVSHFIIQNNRVAIIMTSPGADKPSPQSTVINRSVKLVSGFIPDGKRKIYHLKIMIRTNVAVGVRRIHAVNISNSVKTIQWSPRLHCTFGFLQI